MRKIVLLIVFLIANLYTFSQNIYISSVYEDANTLVIKYNILDDSKAKYKIWLEIKNYKTGELYSVNSVSGDIGEGISAGRNKTIYWNFKADGYILLDTLSIVVKGTRLLKPAAALTSLYCPGKVSTTERMELLGMEVPKKCLWEYAGLSAGIMLYSLSNRYYKIYSLETYDWSRRNRYFIMAKTTRTVSKLTFAATATVWIFDVYKSFRTVKNGYSYNTKVNYNIDFSNNSLLFGIAYKF